ncbi:hypothetical protein [Mycoplasma sp. VS31B]
MISYTHNLNQEQNSNNSYTLYSSAVNNFFRISEEDRLKLLNNLSISSEKIVNLFPIWLNWVLLILKIKYAHDLNKEQSFSTYNENIERIDAILLNLNDLLLFLKENEMSYEKKLDLLSSLTQIRDIFATERDNLVSKVNDLIIRNTENDDYGSGY